MPAEFPFVQRAFAADSRKVVRANAARPSGPGSATGAAGGRWLDCGCYFFAVFADAHIVASELDQLPGRQFARCGIDSAHSVTLW